MFGQKNPCMRRPTKLLPILGIAILFAVGGACIDFTFEWPVRTPGEPPEALDTQRYEIGVRHGLISFSEDDIFPYDDLKAGFKFSAHPPVFRQPAGYGGWMDFAVYGVAPWFLAAIGVLFVWLRKRLRGMREKAEQLWLSSGLSPDDNLGWTIPGDRVAL